MLLTCPICRAECTIDELSVDTVTCPTCGQQLSTRTGTPVPQDVIGDTPAAKDETREWHEGVVSRTADIDVLPVRLGRYFIESLIARGGFAKVYLSTDEALGRRVALKIPRLEKFKTPAKLREFLAEARTAAKLRHPGIVTIFDVGQFANGTNYIAMEYVAGQSLSDLMNAGRVPVPRAVDLLIKVAEAVHDAHRQGLVHRDLKPGNILIDDRGEPRVVDFGLAVHETAQVKLQGEVAGTPAFMSPEQFRGEVHRLDGRTDVWSLGCVFYQLLTGRRPFNGDMTQLYDEVLNKAPKPPRQIDDRIPRELESICFKCLSKSVGDRYTTAKDLAENLSQWQSLQSGDANLPPTRKLPSSVPSDLPLKRQSRRWIVFGVALVGCCTLGLWAASLPLRPKSIENAPPPVRDADRHAIPFTSVVPLIPSVPLDPVDVRSKPMIWLPLLDHKPKPLIWGGQTVTSRWSYDADTQDVLIDATDIMMAEFGETQAEEFKLQISVTKNSWSGSAGLFWGYSPQNSLEPEARQRCQSVYAHFFHEGREPIVRIHRETCEISPVIPGLVRRNIDHTIRITDATAPSAGYGERVLEIHVKRGFVVAVQWQGQDIAQLRDGPLTATTTLPLTHGRFGLMNHFGTSRFRDARFLVVSPLVPTTLEKER